MSGNNPQATKQWRKVHKVIDWQAAGAESLKTAIVAITNAGGAILFSKTMDDGALIVQRFYGGEKSKEYISEPGEIVQYLAWVVEQYS